MPENAKPKRHIFAASMDVLMQKLHGKNQQDHSTLSRDTDNLLFQSTFGIQDRTQLKQHVNTVASIDV